MANFEEQKKKLIEFIKTNDEFSIFYHLDGDGVTSAAILTKAINALGKNVYAHRPTNYEDFDGLDMSEFSKNIIICDINLNEKNIKLFKNVNLCVIDHHEIIDYASILYINPKMWGDTKYTPCALLMYRLLKEYCGDLMWIAAIGLVSDSGGRDNSEFVKEAAEKYAIKLKTDVFLYDNDFGYASSTINSMQIYKGREGIEEALEILLTSNSINDLLNNPALKRIRLEVSRNFKELFEKFDREAETSDQFIYFFDMDNSRKRYSSAAVTALSHMERYYDKILVFMTRIGSDSLRINIRTNDKRIKLPTILREVFKTIEGEGGGHDPAAGGTIKAKDKEKFIELFKECVYNSIKHE